MIVDFFRHGSGLSSGCLDYLLGKYRAREHAQVLDGDVQLTAQLIDSSPFAKKYTSGCLSFYEHDLTEQNKQQIMQNFEQCLFPGLDKSQYKILWVQHQDKLNSDTDQTRLELNFVIPNVELSTGKRLQPFYSPADMYRVDLFKQITNAEHELYSPDDPNNRQLLINKKNLPKDVKVFKDELHQRICQCIALGDITDRQTLVGWLESHDIKVTRQVKRSISIENPYEDAKRPIRLDGEIYEQVFRATGEYRQEVQQRIADYRSTTGDRYRTNVADYQRELEHKSQYHSERYSTVGRENSPEPTQQRPDSGETAPPAPSLTRIKIEPFDPIKRATKDPSTGSSESENREKTYYFDYSDDFTSSYFAYSYYLAWLRQQEQIQRDKKRKHDHQREAIKDRPPEPIRGEFDHQQLQATQQQNLSPLHSDQQGCGQISQQFYDSNGVLSNDRIRNPIIENYRRTAAAITSTTIAIKAASAELRRDAEKNYGSIVIAITSHAQRSQKLRTDAEVISSNTDAISRAGEKYSHVYRENQWQSSANEPDRSRPRQHARENLDRTEFTIVGLRESSTELARNFRDIEKSIVQIGEPKNEVEKPRPKQEQDRGMDFGM